MKTNYKIKNKKHRPYNTLLNTDFKDTMYSLVVILTSIVILLVVYFTHPELLINFILYILGFDILVILSFQKFSRQKLWFRAWNIIKFQSKSWEVKKISKFDFMLKHKVQEWEDKNG